MNHLCSRKYRCTLKVLLNPRSHSIFKRRLVRRCRRGVFLRGGMTAVPAAAAMCGRSVGSPYVVRLYNGQRFLAQAAFRVPFHNRLLRCRPRFAISQGLTVLPARFSDYFGRYVICWPPRDASAIAPFVGLTNTATPSTNWAPAAAP